MRLRDSDIARFNSKVDRSAGPQRCWPFDGYAQRSGHCDFWLDGGMRGAHRVAWEIANGPIPEGMCVCHHCDNPPCCNPAHLFLGTVADNNADRDRKGRGRIPSPDQVRRRPRGPTVHGTLTAYVKHRCHCAKCRARMREYRAERKAARSAQPTLEGTTTP